MARAPTHTPPNLTGAVADAVRDATEKILLERVQAAPVPGHLAIIMDGNRRFASGHGLLIQEGHIRGKDKIEELLDWCLEVGIRILTVYALSTENLQRTPEEIDALMDLFAASFRDIAVDERVHRHGIRVKAIGHTERLRPDVQEAIRVAETATQGYSNYRYNVAIAYGGREEILDAVRFLAQEVAEGKIRPEQIDSAMIAQHLYTADLPDPDLVFRTSGEERISNFLLWQSAYAELYFADVLWPGLTKTDFLRAIRAYQNRRRRYGA